MQLQEKKQYVKLLAGSMGVNLEKLEKKVKFTTFYRKHKSKESINKALFEIIQANKENKENITIPKSLMEKKAKLSQSVQTKLVKTAELKMNRREIKIAKLMSNISKIQAEIVLFNQEKEKALGIDVDITEQFVKITKAGFFSIAVHSGDVLLFDTVNDIICTDIDNKELQVNLGKLVVRLDIATMDVSVFAVDSIHTKTDLIQKNFFRTAKYNDNYGKESIHPYVATGGWICWGNAQPIITKLKKSLEIEKMFQLLASLLITHSGGGFRHLSAYQGK
jgi:hypothetical protein